MWTWDFANTILSPVMVQRFVALQGDFIGLLEQDYTAVDVCTGEFDSLILPHVNTGCMQLFLNEVLARHPDERNHHGD